MPRPFRQRPTNKNAQSFPESEIKLMQSKLYANIGTSSKKEDQLRKAEVGLQQGSCYLSILEISRRERKFFILDILCRANNSQKESEPPIEDTRR